MDWKTSFDCDSFLDKERNHHGYYWLDTVALTSFIENLLEQERKRMSDDISKNKVYDDGDTHRTPVNWHGFNDGLDVALSIINK